MACTLVLARRLSGIVMSKKRKLLEAENFLQQMEKHITKPNIWRFNYSAFLSASRSVMQYILKEVENDRAGKTWYDSRLENDILKYFKKQRNKNTHETPANPPSDIVIGIGAAVISTSGKKENNLPGKGASQDPLHDIIGAVDKDLTSASREYLQEIKLVLQDGIEKGFITDN